jgi:hypothetical protein
MKRLEKAANLKKDTSFGSVSTTISKQATIQFIQEMMDIIYKQLFQNYDEGAYMMITFNMGNYTDNDSKMCPPRCRWHTAYF